MHPKELKIEDFTYNLPDERIAKFPLTDRSSSKLLTYKGGNIAHTTFRNIGDELPENAMLVFNNTRVIQARIVFHKSSGARIEVFLLEPHAPRDYASNFAAENEVVWQCMVGNAAKWKEGSLEQTVQIAGDAVTLKADCIDKSGKARLIRLSWSGAVKHTFADIVDAAGELPIPPYLNRKTEESDKTTYQTVYSKIKGSVAAPTAGLHFTSDLIESLQKKGIRKAELTLHVGAGTFQPVKAETMDGHEMHSEVISVRRETIESVKSALGNIIAVGTTSVRTLESLYYIGVAIADAKSKGIAVDGDYLHVEQWTPYDTNPTLSADESLKAILDYLDAEGKESLVTSTQIIIAPSYKFKIVRGIVTNFHQPQSTLLLLVSALVGDDWHEIYKYAFDHGFRFLSYGDSSLLLP